jgi:hypothetical protein
VSGLILPAGQPVDILGSCINCTGSASLLATIVLILFGSALAALFERRKVASGSLR